MTCSHSHCESWMCNVNTEHTQMRASAEYRADGRLASSRVEMEAFLILRHAIGVSLCFFFKFLKTRQYHGGLQLSLLIGPGKHIWFESFFLLCDLCECVQSCLYRIALELIRVIRCMCVNERETTSALLILDSDAYTMWDYVYVCGLYADCGSCMCYHRDIHIKNQRFLLLVIYAYK